ncbi:MAG: hypothetical protein IPP36_07595 [Nitrosomonadales bacterium]|nr:hypothetical protein [Nitrosomonadales bacterium]
MRCARSGCCGLLVEGKKVPRQARSPQRNASTTKPATWAGIDAAQAAAVGSGLGMGFVFSHADPLVFVDLDWDDQPSELQSRIIAKLDSYTEVSPSGAGAYFHYSQQEPDSACRED